MLYPTSVNPGPMASGSASPVSSLPPALAGLPAGSPVSGTVVGREGPGLLLMRTAAGMALVASSLKLARGTVVNLRVRQGASPHLSIESVASKPGAIGAPQPGLGFSLMSDLAEALDVLGKAGPGPAQGLAQNIALPGNRLASAVLFFLTALKRGDFTGWFGSQAIKALESRGHANLLSRLMENFSAQTRVAEAPPSGEWQTLLVPLYVGETVRQIRFFLRRNRADGDGDQDNRFVVEVETSPLGGLQLDGLIKPGRFDLVLRSHKPLSDVVRRDISEIYESGLAITGHAGRMVFQAMEKFPVPAMEAGAGEAHQGLLV